MMEKQACYRIEKRPSSGEPHQSNALEFLKKPYFSIRGHSIQLSTSKHIVAFSPTIHDSSYSSNEQIPNSSISTLPDTVTRIPRKISSTIRNPLSNVINRNK